MMLSPIIISYPLIRLIILRIRRSSSQLCHKYVPRGCSSLLHQCLYGGKTLILI